MHAVRQEFHARGKKQQQWTAKQKETARQKPHQQIRRHREEMYHCGLNHGKKKSDCPAVDKICLKCKKKGHYARVCRSKQANPQKKPVKYVEEQEDVEYVHLNHIHSATAGEAFATFRVFGKPEDIQFQIDTGVSCNVIPFKDYGRATGDKGGQKLDKTNTILVMHNMQYSGTTQRSDNNHIAM